MGFHLFVAYNTVHCQNEWERVREMRNRPLLAIPESTGVCMIVYVCIQSKNERMKVVTINHFKKVCAPHLAHTSFVVNNVHLRNE